VKKSRTTVWKKRSQCLSISDFILKFRIASFFFSYFTSFFWEVTAVYDDASINITDLFTVEVQCVGVKLS
jgi:hypothetical protein